MAWALLIGHGLVGIAIIAADVISVRCVIHAKRQGFPRLGLLVAVAGTVGAGLAAVSLLQPLFFGYPIPLADGRGRVIGIPFLVAIFDARGRDYVGPLTLPSAIANAIVLWVAPMIILAIYIRHRQRKLRP